MERTIKIDLKQEEDLYERYDDSIVARDLVDYIVARANAFSLKDKITIVINDYIGHTNCEALIKEGFKNDYFRYFRRYQLNNIMQLIYFIVGVIIIFGATFLGDTSVLHEILLICGWVLIWEMVEIEIITDLENRRRRRVLKKLKTATFIINEKGD